VIANSRIQEIEGDAKIQPQSFSDQPVSNWQDDPKLSQVEIVVCTASYTLTGHTYRLHPQRLLDALNKGFSASDSHIAKDFVPLTEVEVFFPDGRQEYMASTYIRKTNILFVAERGRQEQLDEPGIEDKSKIYVKRAKKPLGVKVYMPFYTLVGKMYGEMWQQLLYVLNRDEMFLPLTDVEVSPELVCRESRFDFVAINKDQLIYIVELPG
jgi:hypothetical protein